jgi:signal peptidase
VLEAFEWLSPVLPNPSWAFKSFFSVVYCVTTMLVLAVVHQEKLPSEDKVEGNFRDVVGWVVVGILGVVLVWFFSGVFTYKPVLIAGRSMEPTIRIGDIAVYADVSSEELKEGDIIVFYQEKGRIIHRIVRIETREGRLLYITKGDANRDVDADPVREEQVIGKVVFVIPKVGWVSIALKNLINYLF